MGDLAVSGLAGSARSFCAADGSNRAGLAHEPAVTWGMGSLKVRLRIDFGPDNAVGPGKIALLERMRASGSLSQAARELNMSYRRAWQLQESLNAAFKEPVIITSVGGKGGGGSTITELGDQLIDAYRRLENESLAKARTCFETLSAKLADAMPAAKASRRSIGANSANADDKAARRRPITKSARPRAARGTRGRGSKRP